MHDYIALPVGVLDATHVSESIALFGWILDKQINPAKIRSAWGILTTAWPVLVSRLHLVSEVRAESSSAFSVY